MKYSVVIPIYNDGYLAQACCEEVARVFATLPGGMELIFVNDGSKNDSLQTLIGLTDTYDFVRVIDLSRNFGQHNALACGFQEAKGDIVIRLNVDMQDAPSEIPKLLKVMEDDDADLVVGQYAERKGSIKDKITSHIYFAVFNFMTGMTVPQRTSSLRLMSRRYLNAYNSLTEKSRFPQGLDFWLGFRHRYVIIEHQMRPDKKSSYNFWSRLSLALTGLLYFSDRPIKLVMLLGFGVACLGFMFGAYLLLARLMGADFQSGYVSLVALGLFSFGIQLTSLGLVGLYIGKIFKEVQNRPLYLVRETYAKTKN